MISHLLKGAELPPPGHYIVAVSGGVDSMALLHFLATHERADNWQLRVAHYNHGIRPDSHVDQRLVRDISRVYGLPFHSEDGNLGPASEETARKARYQFLQNLLDHYGADAIITAHHLDDRQETSLFNVARGTGAVGAGALRSGLTLLRPLLGVRKSDLHEYAAGYRLPWREDSTNTDIRFARNFIRSELLPLGRSAMPDFDRRFGVTLTRLDGLNEAVGQQLGSLVQQSGGVVRLDRAAVAPLQSQTIQQALLYMSRRLEPGAEISQRTLQKAARLVKTGASGQEATLTGQLMLRITPNAVEVSSVDRAMQYLVAQELLPNGSVRFGTHQLSLGTEHNGDSEHHHVTGEDLKVRVVRPGDRIAPAGMAGTKKLQDMFVDAKIDRNDRAGWPVVTRTTDDQVVWVPRLAVSRHFLLSPEHPQAYCLIHEVISE